MKFSDIPASIKMTVASVAVIFTAVTFLYATFQTDVEAAQYQQQNTEEIKRFRIQDLKKQIRELEYKMEFTQPPPKAEKWMKKQVDDLKQEIDKPILHRPLTIAPVILGDGCDIGVNSVILPGVTLGNNVQVGAGAVVTKSFEEGSIVTGVPVRRIKGQ